MRSSVSVEEELVWRLAGTAEARRRHDARIRALGTSATFTGVASILQRHRLTPVLGPRAQAIAPTPTDFDAMVTEARRRAERRALVFEGQSQRIHERLAHNGIPAVSLKGVELARVAHGSPGARISDDIDVLVPAGRVDDAVRALGELGYRSAPEGRRSKIHAVLVHHEPWQPPVEVHWRVHWYGDRFAARMLADAVENGAGRRTAPPAATMVALLLFYARDGLAGLRLPVDIASYADAMGDRLPTGEILAYVAEDPDIGPPVHAALRVLRESVGLQLLPQAPRLRQRDAMAIRLSNWRLAGEPDQIIATVRLVDVLLAPSRRWRDFVASRFAPFDSAVANGSYLVKTLLRWCLALPTIMRGRTAHPLPHRRAGVP